MSAGRANEPAKSITVLRKAIVIGLSEPAEPIRFLLKVTVIGSNKSAESIRVFLEASMIGPNKSNEPIRVFLQVTVIGPNNLLSRSVTPQGISTRSSEKSYFSLRRQTQNELEGGASFVERCLTLSETSQGGKDREFQISLPCDLT